LNERQKKFLELYLLGESPTGAYQEAYDCSKRIANVSAYRLLENVSIKEAIEESQKRAKERREKRLDKLVDKSIEELESVYDIDEDDPLLTPVKIRAKELKIKVSENHLSRMGFDSPEKHEHSGTVNLTWQEIIYGTADKELNEDRETGSSE
jgi:phage terminase small subunit